MSDQVLCRACGQESSIRRARRGLCQRCYRDPIVNRRFCRGRRLPEPTRPASFPTRFAPGTRGKVRILIARHAAGEHLWHPLDPDIFGRFLSRD